MKISKQRNNIISIIKIIACISVYIIHYFDSVRLNEYITSMRANKGILRIVLIWFTQGDLGNIVFFVCSGFLLSYFCDNENNILSKTIKYIIHLIIPTVGIILISALCFYLISFLGDESFISYHIRADIDSVLYKGGSVYYGPQLWYVNTQIRGYVIYSLIQYLVMKQNNKVSKYTILLCSSLLFILLREYYIFCVSIGVLSGNLAKEFEIPKSLRITMVCVDCILFPFIPYIFSNFCRHWDGSFFSWGYIVVSIFISILIILGVYIYTKNNQILNVISKFTFPIYLVHMLIFELYIKLRNYFDFTINKFIEFIIVLAITIIVAIVYAKITNVILGKIKYLER